MGRAGSLWELRGRRLPLPFPALWTLPISTTHVPLDTPPPPVPPWFCGDCLMHLYPEFFSLQREQIENHLVLSAKPLFPNEVTLTCKGDLAFQRGFGGEGTTHHSEQVKKKKKKKSSFCPAARKLICFLWI